MVCGLSSSTHSTVNSNTILTLCKVDLAGSVKNLTKFFFCEIHSAQSKGAHRHTFSRGSALWLTAAPAML